MSDEPGRRELTREIVVYALLFLLFGAAFVALRVAREGPRVLTYDPRHAR